MAATAGSMRKICFDMTLPPFVPNSIRSKSKSPTVKLNGTIATPFSRATPFVPFVSRVSAWLQKEPAKSFRRADCDMVILNLWFWQCQEPRTFARHCRRLVAEKFVAQSTQSRGSKCRGNCNRRNPADAESGQLKSCFDGR